MLLYIYPERAGIPGIGRVCHSSLGSSGDISIPQSGVSRGHRYVPLQSDDSYTPTPDSSGLRGFPNRTPLRSEQTLPKCPTSPSDTLNGAAPAHLRTTLIYSPDIYYITNASHELDRASKFKCYFSSNFACKLIK